jgi:hypothetical protein
MESIKIGGASFDVMHVLSFSSEKEFTECYKSKVYQDLAEKEIILNLKAIYKNAKKMESKD